MLYLKFILHVILFPMINFIIIIIIISKGPHTCPYLSEYAILTQSLQRVYVLMFFLNITPAFPMKAHWLRKPSVET